eukprot:6177818-Pleurochrysis_carterae.AAC.2
MSSSASSLPSSSPWPTCRSSCSQRRCARATVQRARSSEAMLGSSAARTAHPEPAIGQSKELASKAMPVQMLLQYKRFDMNMLSIISQFALACIFLGAQLSRFLACSLPCVKKPISLPV